MGAHNFPTKHQAQAAEYPASGKGEWVAGIGYMKSWGTTVPAAAATGYGKGCTHVHTDGGGTADLLYVNVGDRNSADFRAVPVASVAGTAAGAGMSPAIWRNSLWAAVENNPELGYRYWNDHMGLIDVTSADGYVITQVNSGAIVGTVDEDGGILLIDSAGNNAADDGVNVQLENCTFKPLAGRTIRYEARIALNDNSALTSQFAIGLAAPGTTALIAAGAIEDTVDKCLWFHHGASTADKMSVICSRAAANDTDADKATTVDDTYIKLGFVITGLTKVEWYANGVLVHTSDVAAQVPNAIMCPSYVAQTEGAAKDAEMSIDWEAILMEGTRT